MATKSRRSISARRKDYFVEPGNYELLVGGASDDLRLRVPLQIAGMPITVLNPEI
jgi:hypothetical protein